VVYLCEPDLGRANVPVRAAEVVQPLQRSVISRDFPELLYPDEKSGSGMSLRAHVSADGVRRAEKWATPLHAAHAESIAGRARGCARRRRRARSALAEHLTALRERVEN
jgi:hypothetical protein